MSGGDMGEERRKVLRLIEGIDYALLTTRGADGEPLHARPMAYREVENDGDLWFFTNKDSRKVEELSADPRVLVNFADPKKQCFVSLTGCAEVVAERSKVEAMWSEIYRPWFPKGAEDENVVLLKIRAERAEYWDTPTGAMAYAFGYVQAVATGKPHRAGEIGVVEEM